MSAGMWKFTDFPVDFRSALIIPYVFLSSYRVYYDVLGKLHHRMKTWKFGKQKLWVYPQVEVVIYLHLLVLNLNRLIFGY